MTKRKSRHAKDTAAQQPEAGAAADAQDHGAPETEGLLDGGDRDAAETEQAQHQGEPAGTDQPDPDGELSDGKEPGDAGDGSIDDTQFDGDAAGDAADNAGPDAGAAQSGEDAGSVLVGSGELDAGGSADAGAEDDVVVCPICLAKIEAADLCASDIEMGTCHAACLEGSPVVDLETGEVLPDGELSTYRLDDAGTKAVNENWADRFTDERIHAAACTACTLLDHLAAGHIGEKAYHRCDIVALGNPDCINALAVYIRTIGRDRAKPAVIAQQLKILGHWDSADLLPAEEFVLAMFISTLLSFDDFIVAETARTAKPVVHEVPPMPIEDTTMELVDDVMGSV